MNGMTGMNTVSYDPKFCGKCIKITGPRGTLSPVHVIDVCDPAVSAMAYSVFFFQKSAKLTPLTKNCAYLNPKHIDIYDPNSNGDSVYTLIANPILGVVDVTWEWLPSCN